MRLWMKEGDAAIPVGIADGIRECAVKNNIEKVILFGSRAQKNNWDKSDIDLAVTGGDEMDLLMFRESLEELPTLLIFDVVDMRSLFYSKEIDREINKNGVLIYEKI